MSILVQDGQKWHSVFQSGQKCSKGIQYSPKRPTIVNSDKIWSNFIQNHPKWSKAVQNSLRIIKDQAGHSWNYFWSFRSFWMIFYYFAFFSYDFYAPDHKKKQMKKRKPQTLTNWWKPPNPDLWPNPENQTQTPKPWPQTLNIIPKNQNPKPNQIASKNKAKSLIFFKNK